MSPRPTFGATVSIKVLALRSCERCWSMPARTHHIQRLYAEASEFSLGLFKKFGFRLYDTELVNREGVQFTRYLVELLHE